MSKHIGGFALLILLSLSSCFKGNFWPTTYTTQSTITSQTSLTTLTSTTSTSTTLTTTTLTSTTSTSTTLTTTTQTSTTLTSTTLTTTTLTITSTTLTTLTSTTLTTTTSTTRTTTTLTTTTSTLTTTTSTSTTLTSTTTSTLTTTTITTTTLTSTTTSTSTTQTSTTLTTLTTTTLTSTTSTSLTSTTTSTLTSTTTTTTTVIAGTTTTYLLDVGCDCYSLLYDGETVAFTNTKIIVEDGNDIAQITGWDGLYHYTSNKSLRVMLKDEGDANTVASMGYVFDASGQDWTSFNYFKFWLRSGSGGELSDNAQIALRDTLGSVSNFVDIGSITTSYDNFNFPISLFTGIDISKVSTVVFQSDTATSSTPSWSYFYVDDIEISCYTQPNLIIYDGEIEIFSGNVTVYEGTNTNATSVTSDPKTPPNSMYIVLDDQNGAGSGNGYAELRYDFNQPYDMTEMWGFSIDMDFDIGSNTSIFIALWDGTVASNYIDVGSFGFTGYETKSVDLSLITGVDQSNVVGVFIRRNSPSWGDTRFWLDNIRGDCRGTP